jgi:hypothetical protein
VSVLSSPRRRRRALWAGAAAVAVGGFLVVNALVPSHGGAVRSSPLETTGSTLGQSVAEEAAAERSAAAVRPLATRFVDDLAGRHDLDRAYAVLAPRTRDHYSLLDWQAGRDLPLHGATSSTGGPSLAFAGRSTVGFVAALAPNILFAVRFDKLPVLGWRVAYMHQGEGSSHVDESSFSPAGLAPGAHHETVWTWLILAAGFAALVTVVALADHRLSRAR